MSAPHVNPSSPIQSPNPAAPAVFNRPESKVFELPQKDVDEIPETQKTILFAMPGEQDSIWTEYTFSDGNKISSTTSDSLIRHAPIMLQMLINAEAGGYTHLAFGGFKFKYNSASSRISRSPFIKKSSATTGAKSFTPWTRQPAKPKFLADVYTDSVEGIHEFLKLPENKGKWEPLRDPVISEKDGKVIMVIARYQYD